MPNAEDVYTKCDDLAAIPTLMRNNYLFESRLLATLLPASRRVLQIGSMDGERAIRLLRERPDLQLSGLEIEEQLVSTAKKKASSAGFEVNFIHGDVTEPPSLPKFDYVICLNNTLGYIPDQEKALAGMRKLGKKVIISVYGEKFSVELAREYFDSLGLMIENIQNNTFVMKDFTEVRRYRRKDVKVFSQEITETPVGYFCLLA